MKDVPPSLRNDIGRKRLVRTTATTDILKARVKRHGILAEMVKRIDDARRGVGAGVGLIGEALGWSKELQAYPHGEARGDVETGIDERAREIEAEQGEAKAQAFYELASGLSTPLGVHHDDWLAEKKPSVQYAHECRRGMQQLTDWLQAHDYAPSIQAVTSRVASAFKADAVVRTGKHHKTGNKLLSGYRSYWTWLVNAGHAESNPWQGKSLPKTDSVRDEKERPFTDQEVARLLGGNTDVELAASMKIAALSGMRIEEIFRLQVKHCGNSVFQVAYGYKGKTKSAAREVPIHTLLQTLVASLIEGRRGDDYLLRGSDGGWGETRSMACSKRFTTYRKRLGIHELVEGKRRSRVNFHSWRRWFITKADQAGMTRDNIERTVGHKPQGESLGTYSGGLTLGQARAVVESVTLPLL